jgi:N utilization substance protein B
MLCRSDIPHAVSINEAIEIAKTMGDVGSARFVNGVLDRLRKEFAGKTPSLAAPPGAPS